MATPSTNLAPAPRAHDLIWQAPLALVALPFTTGIVLDRHFSIPLATSIAIACAALFAWGTSLRSPLKAGAPLFVAIAIAASGAACHHGYREWIPANDVRFVATTEGRPVRLRGVIDSEPVHLRGILDDPLRTFPTKPSTRMAVEVRQVEQPQGWSEVSGRVQVILAGRRADLHVGDDVEMVGRLGLPTPPGNPGEFDYTAFLADQQISAVLSVPEAPDAVVVLREGWPGTFFGWLAVLRGRGVKVLEDYLPPPQRNVAAALLVGDVSGMTGNDWEGYLRTGVIHVLAISGQHLFVLAGFLGLVSRCFFVRRRYSILVIAGVLVAYALLTGGRPPVMRAAWVVAASTVGWLLRKLVLPANNLALAWIGIAVFNPTDVFNSGCQLSFLAVAVLIWGTRNWQTREVDPLQRLIDESRSWVTVGALNGCRWLGRMYAINALVWLAVMPLVADRYHLISPVALVIGPPVVLLSSLALLLGFGLLATAPVLPPVAALFAWLTKLNLMACERLVDWSSHWPGAYVFVPNVASWWLVVFYLGLAVWLGVPWLQLHWRWCASVGAGWLGVGTIVLFWPSRPQEFRCTILAVGHGGCTIIETPGGRILVYDAGAVLGPDVTRRHIAPFLWSRGHRRIDEVFISHGDLDHFNGLTQLIDRFAVSQVTMTPTFMDRGTPGINETRRALERYGIAPRVVNFPDRWETDGIEFEVLHPPAKGPEGIENERSLVLAIRHGDLSILLTGDLEKAGLARVLTLPSRGVDVLMAPHHGSRTANTADFAHWARPRFVVSCQGPPKSVPREPNPYEAIGARWLSTWSQGAVTIRRVENAFVVETHQTRNRWTIGRQR